MGFSEGTGSFKARLATQRTMKLSQRVLLKLEVYRDPYWDIVEATEDVCEKVKQAKEVLDIWLEPGGEFGEWVQGTIRQTREPGIWYYAISECGTEGVSSLTKRVKFEFEALQSDGSHASIEMKGMGTVNVLALLFFSALIYKYVILCRDYWKSARDLHPVIWTLTIAMVVQYIAQLFHTIHMVVYFSDGRGMKAMHVLSEILFMLAQVLQTSLLILIGLGYTLLQSHIGELDLMIPMCFMIAVIHIMLVGFGKIKDDAAYKYHENEGVIGWLLLVLRLLLYIWFLWAVTSTAKEGGMKLKTFLIQFRAAGSLYFLAFPVFFLIVRNLQPHSQHFFMATSLLVMQLCSNVWLTLLFLTRGEYFKVSSLNSSDLPGGVRIGIMKEE